MAVARMGAIFLLRNYGPTERERRGQGIPSASKSAFLNANCLESFFKNMLPAWAWSTILQKSDETNDEKYENRIQSACENASDAKQSLPKRSLSARSAKTIMFWTIQGGNAPRKM